MTFLGDMAYSEARTRARTCRRKGDRKGNRLWSKVAVRIAKETGYQIGLKAADRYEQDGNSHKRDRARHFDEIAGTKREILSALTEIARNRDVETGVHNVGAHVRNALDLVGQDPAVTMAGAEVCRTAAQLAAEAKQSADLIDEGRYPPALELAAYAVERLREALAQAQERRRI